MDILQQRFEECKEELLEFIMDDERCNPVDVNTIEQMIMIHEFTYDHLPFLKYPIAGVVADHIQYRLMIKIYWKLRLEGN